MIDSSSMFMLTCPFKYFSHTIFPLSQLYVAVENLQRYRRDSEIQPKPSRNSINDRLCIITPFAFTFFTIEAIEAALQVILKHSTQYCHVRDLYGSISNSLPSRFFLKRFFRNCNKTIRKLSCRSIAAMNAAAKSI